MLRPPPCSGAQHQHIGSHPHCTQTHHAHRRPVHKRHRHAMSRRRRRRRPATRKSTTEHALLRRWWRRSLVLLPLPSVSLLVLIHAASLPTVIAPVHHHATTALRDLRSRRSRTLRSLHSCQRHQPWIATWPHLVSSPTTSMADDRCSLRSNDNLVGLQTATHTSALLV
jgi:hypothetical protein